MKLNSTKLKQISKTEIFTHLSSVITDIFLEYNFLDLTNAQFEEIILREINKSIDEYNDEASYSTYMKNLLIEIFDSIIIMQLKDKNTCFKIIDNYINMYLKSTDDYDEALEYLNKLIEFLRKYNFIPEQDLLITIISHNKIIESILKIIVSKNNKINKEFTDTIIIKLIEIYCELHKKKRAQKDLYAVNKVVDSYLNEIGPIPLLTLDEERALGFRILEGDEEAISIMVQRNLKLVPGVAKKYLGFGLSFMDLIQEGNMGLLEAARRFDVQKGYKFSTYAIWWIRQSVSASVFSKSKIIRLPVYVHTKIFAYIKACSKLQEELNREPTNEEIAKELKISVSKVKELQRIQMTPTSTNTPIGDGDDLELGDLIPSEDDSPDDIVIAAALQEKVLGLLESCNISGRNLEIIKLRYGFVDGRCWKQEEVSQKYNITTSRVGQIEEKIIKKIRMSRYIKDLAVFMDYPEESVVAIDEYRQMYRDNVTIGKRKKEEDDDSYIVTKQKIKTVYELFNEYTREEVDIMLTMLNDEEDKELLTLRYGDDLDNPVTSPNWTRRHKKRFYSYLYKKMTKILENNRKEKAGISRTLEKKGAKL